MDIIVEEAYCELNTIIEKWRNCYDTDYSGGKMRSNRGSDIEMFVQKYIKKLGETYKVDLTVMSGSKNKKTLIINNNNKILKKEHQVDIHIYKENKFVAVIECKAYLDSCYYVRACDDFRLFKKFGHNIKSYIFSLENSIDEDTKEFIDVDSNNVCDGVFYVFDDKRSSNKPVFNKKYKKKVNKELITLFLNKMKADLID